MDGRQDWVIGTTESDPELAAVCAAVHDAVAVRAVSMRVDAQSEHYNWLPDDIRTVERWMAEQAIAQNPTGGGVGVTITPEDDRAWIFGRAYTPWSINVDVFDADDREIATFHDGGWSVIAYLSDTEAQKLAATLPNGRALEPLLVVKERRRQTKRAQRRTGIRNALRFRR